MKATSAAGLAKVLSRKPITAPFGPASTRSIPAVAAKLLDRNHFQQVVHLVRQRPEAVDQLGGEAVERRAGRRGRRAGGRGRAARRGRGRRSPGSARSARARSAGSTPSACGRRRRRRARCGDRVLQHLLVELDADLADVARLLVAQQVAGAADVEVVAGDGEARRRARPAPASPTAASRAGARQLAARRQGQVGVGAQLPPPDPAAQLVELRQAEHVGAVDDDGVDRRAGRGRSR